MVTDVVHAHGRRVVKFIGDEVMWVNSNPDLLARTAADLVNHPQGSEPGPRIRAGLGDGTLLALNGDYFGNPVHLAARVVGVASPGQVLISAVVRDARCRVGPQYRKIR